MYVKHLPWMIKIFINVFAFLYVEAILFFQKSGDVSIFVQIQGYLSRKNAYAPTPIFLCGFQ